MIIKNQLLFNKTNMRKLLQWRWTTFESSTWLTEQYAEFNKWFKRVMKSIAKNLWWTITWFKPNHFCTSWFITVWDKYVYISISDVRYFKDAWCDNVLIRTAKSVTDYTWWGNNYSELKNLRATAEKLLELN